MGKENKWQEEPNGKIVKASQWEKSGTRATAAVAAAVAILQVASASIA